MPTRTHAGVRGPVLWGAVVGGCLVLLGVAWLRPGPAPRVGPTEPGRPAPATDRTDTTTPRLRGPPEAGLPPTAAESLVRPAAPPFPGLPSTETRDLVRRLAEAGVREPGALPALVHAGTAAIPAIRDHLLTPTNTPPAAPRQPGETADPGRLALIEALRQIGGAEAARTLADVLRSSVDPLELRQLSGALDALEPGVHNAEIIAASRRLLTAVPDSATARVEVGPVFATLAEHGGTAAPDDWEQWGSRWRYYAGIALANLPDAGGVGTLVGWTHLASPEDRSLALGLLAQGALGLGSVEARDALMDAVRTEPMTPEAWAAVASIVGGDRYLLPDQVREAARGGARFDDLKPTHIFAGNQSFYLGSPAGGWTDAQRARGVELVDSLLDLAPPESALAALRTVRDSLQAPPRPGR